VGQFESTGALEPRKIRNEQDGQNSVHDPDNRHRDRSLQWAEEDQCNDGKLFDDGSGQDRTREAGTYALYTVSEQTTKSSAPQCRTKNIVTPSELFAPNTNCRVVRGKKSPASPPAAVPIPEIMRIHPMDDASIHPLRFFTATFRFHGRRDVQHPLLGPEVCRKNRRGSVPLRLAEVTGILLTLGIAVPENEVHGNLLRIPQSGIQHPPLSQVTVSTQPTVELTRTGRSISRPETAGRQQLGPRADNCRHIPSNAARICHHCRRPGRRQTGPLWHDPVMLRDDFRWEPGEVSAPDRIAAQSAVGAREISETADVTVSLSSLRDSQSTVSLRDLGPRGL
jgi:hypothetical protein